MITLIIVGVVVQNTCPQGWAAKTAFVTCHGSHCPMHKQKEPKQDGQDDVKRGISNVKQAFVIHVVGQNNAYQILDYKSDILPIDSLTLSEIFSEPLFRPPILSIFA